MTRTRTSLALGTESQVLLHRSAAALDPAGEAGRSRRAVAMRRAWMGTAVPGMGGVPQEADLDHASAAPWLDPGTGLPGPLAFERALGAALREAPGARFGSAVVVVQPDGLGLPGTGLGPTTEDELLGAVAGRLSACLRRRDLLARLTRHSFGVLVRDVVTPDDAIHVAQRALEAVRRPIALLGAGASLTASAGVATGGKIPVSPGSLVRAARLALERAQVDGGDRWTSAAPVLHAATVTRDDLETELRAALDADGLVLEFQPERRIAGAMGQAGTIRSVEALVRWRHLSRGVIPPAVFLPMAEETGLIERIGSWVLHQAVAQARTWQVSDPAYHGLSVAVNLSPREVARRDLVAEVRQVLEEHSLEPGTLTLEITEAAIVADRPAAIVTLGGLRELGVRVALDDCVGGPDIVERLRDVPLDLLKLDPSLTSALGAGGSGDAVRTLLGAARTLGLQTVGEGVETRQQLNTLRDSGCDLAQGYFFGKPLGAAGITALLRAERRRRAHPASGRR